MSRGLEWEFHFRFLRLPPAVAQGRGPRVPSYQFSNTIVGQRLGRSGVALCKQPGEVHTELVTSLKYLTSRELLFDCSAYGYFSPRANQNRWTAYISRNGAWTCSRKCFETCLTSFKVQQLLETGAVVHIIRRSAGVNISLPKPGSTISQRKPRPDSGLRIRSSNYMSEGHSARRSYRGLCSSAAPPRCCVGRQAAMVACL